MKICKECENEYDESEFYTQKHKRKSKKKGVYVLEILSSYCKPCDRAKSKRVKDSSEYKERTNTTRRSRKQTDPEYRDKVNKQKRESLRNNPERRMLAHAKARSKKNGYNMDITIDDIVIPHECPLLNVPFITGTKDCYLYTPTLDRIDSTKGYTKDNLWVISMLANSMKNSANVKQLLTFAKNIQNHFQDDIVRTA